MYVLYMCVHMGIFLHRVSLLSIVHWSGSFYFVMVVLHGPL